MRWTDSCRSLYCTVVVKTLIIILLSVSQLIAQSKYCLECSEDLLKVSLDSAISQIGIIEKTNKNDGDVEKYLSIFNLRKGNPYCAAGQYWCFYSACKDLKFSMEKIPIVKSALANNIFNMAKIQGLKTKYKVEKNDLIVWKIPISRHGHIERVYKIISKTWVQTIAFNVKSKIGKEGVFIKKRNIFSPLGRLRIRGLIGFIKK